MKIIAAIILVLSSFSASAAILDYEIVKDFKKICVYSDGTVIVLSNSYGLCPLSK